MATTTQRIQLRRDTAANWTSNNPTLQAGEVGFETDTGKFKIGDGSTAWTSRGYATNVALALPAGTATVAPLVLTSGTNLTTAAAGALEYDGTTLWATPSTNYGRASVPATIYTSGAGTTLGTNTETTNTVLFPSANDTITLPVGTYLYNLVISMTRGASATSAFLRVRLGGAGTAVGTFSGHAYGSATDGGAVNMYRYNSITLNTDIQVGPASTTSSSIQESVVTGILRITTSGTFIPGYSLSALLNVAGVALPASNSLTLQAIATSGSAASTGAWA